MSAVLMGPNDPPQKIQVGNYTLEVAFRGPADPRLLGRHRRSPPPSAAAIFIATGPDEYFAAGSGVSVTFSPNTPGPPLAGLATVEEGTFVNGRWVPGPPAGGGRHRAGQVSPAHMGIQRFTLYRYR